MAESKASHGHGPRAARKPHRADDKRRGDHGDNAPYRIDAIVGIGKPLAIFNDRRGTSVGQGKKAF